MDLSGFNSYEVPYRGPAVYFLFRGSELVYIGSTKNLLQRLGGHSTKPAQAFDRYGYIPSTLEDMRRLEHEMIGKFNPTYNGWSEGLQTKERKARMCGQPSI